MKIAYADPPYPGCAHRYRDHIDFDGEVDHSELIGRLERDFDGYILHTASTTLAGILQLFERPYRIMAWVKPFAAFKANVTVAYAWEPVIIRAARKPDALRPIIMRDWVAESITLRKGLVGAKPPAVIRWSFEMVGALANDQLDDLYPGTGIVGRTWDAWCGQFEDAEQTRLL